MKFHRLALLVVIASFSAQLIGFDELDVEFVNAAKNCESEAIGAMSDEELGMLSKKFTERARSPVVAYSFHEHKFEFVSETELDGSEMTGLKPLINEGSDSDGYRYSTSGYACDVLNAVALNPQIITVFLSYKNP